MKQKNGDRSTKTREECTEDEGGDLAVRGRPAWTPFQLMTGMDRDINSMWRDLAVMTPSSLWSEENMRRFWGLDLPDFDWNLTAVPPVDIRDTGKEYVIEADLPGLSKENLEVQVTDNTVRISGCKERNGSEEREGYLWRERAYTNFYRQIPLPEKVVPEDVETVFKDGILRVRLRKKNPKAKKRAHKVRLN